MRILDSENARSLERAAMSYLIATRQLVLAKKSGKEITHAMIFDCDVALDRIKTIHHSLFGVKPNMETK